MNRRGLGVVRNCRRLKAKAALRREIMFSSLLFTLNPFLPQIPSGTRVRHCNRLHRAMGSAAERGALLRRHWITSKYIVVNVLQIKLASFPGRWKEAIRETQEGTREVVVINVVK